jgi:serine/threonine protein phosphatase PrpC
MHEISKKELKLALSNLNSFKERKNINTSIKTSKSTNQNNSFKLKNNNKTYINLIDDSSSIIRKSEKEPTNSKKNRKRKKMINRNINVNLKNFFQYNNNKFQCINEDKFFQDEYNSIYKLFINQKRNENNEKYSDFKKQNNSQKTQIIMKKVRFHDFINRKIELNKTKIVEKLKKGKKGNKKENNKLNYYLPVQGIFYEKNNNNNNSNNLNIKYKKSNMFIVDPPNINENKTKKMDNQSVIKRNEINSSFPLISSNDLKNKTQRMLFNKNSLNIKNFFSNDEINIKINSKKIRNLCNIQGYKKLINYNVISTPGSDYGKSKKNQDSYFIIPQLDNCENVKVFGIFDGHGEVGDILSTEIKEYFKNFFVNLLSYNSELDVDEGEENLHNNFIIKSINNRKIDHFNHYYSTKFQKRKINYKMPEEKKLEDLSFLLMEKSGKINKIYNKLKSNNYSEIYSSYKKLDDELHTKYSNSNFCHLSGSTSLIVFLFNSKNCNKIITSNLGDSKIILISQTNTIKELNTLHTLNNTEEKNRILEHGGVISRLTVGPLRIWYKNKKYPGLSITRSLGDFESDSLGVISIPEVKEYDLDEEQIKILVFGTDGVWKFLTNDKIMDIVLPYYLQNDAEGATQKIKETANNIWNIKNPKGIADITVIVLFFK